MARRRVQIDATGHRGQDIIWPAYALADDDTGDAGAVAAAVARRNRLSVVTMAGDGWQEGRDGKAQAHFYRATLGRPIAKKYGGGWTCDAEIMFRIKSTTEEA